LSKLLPVTAGLYTVTPPRGAFPREWMGTQDQRRERWPLRKIDLCPRPQDRKAINLSSPGGFGIQRETGEAEVPQVRGESLSAEGC
jgi:hypothetical protein